MDTPGVRVCRARGDARPESDFDLLVVLDDATPEVDATDDAAYAPVRGMGVGCDIIPCRRSEWLAVMADPSNPWRGEWSQARRLYGEP